MPRGGSRPGAGRKKGSQNRDLVDAREAFRLVYERRLKDLDRWLLETGDGFERTIFNSEGEPLTVIEKNPGKAADLLIRMAEHFIPKLQRIDKTIADASDEEILAEIQRRKDSTEGVSADVH